MEIVIKIPEKIYKNKNYVDYFGCSSLTLADTIENGTPLPKGHGGWIDACIKLYRIRCGAVNSRR